MTKGSSKLATAREKCRRCGLTEQEMDAALLLIQLSGGDSSSSSSSSVSAAAKGGYGSISELEQGKENDVSTVIQNHNNPLEDYSSKSTKLRKFRSIVDLYQSTAPLRNNNNLHGKRISSSLLLLSFGSDKNRREEEEEERRSDLISDAGSVLVTERRDDG